MNTHLLMFGFRVACFELALSGLNYFVLMNRVYTPTYGELRSHRIGMTTRIIYIPFFAAAMLYFGAPYSTIDLLVLGASWLGFILVFEWGGSFLMRRPVAEILVGWHVRDGYLWPYVLLTYFVAPLAIGLLFSPGM